MLVAAGGGKAVEIRIGTKKSNELVRQLVAVAVALAVISRSISFQAVLAGAGRDSEAIKILVFTLDRSGQARIFRSFPN